MREKNHSAPKLVPNMRASTKCEREGINLKLNTGGISVKIGNSGPGVP